MLESRRYWKAGFMLTLVSAFINRTLDYFSSTFSSIPTMTIYQYGSLKVAIPMQMEWMAMMIMFFAAVIVIVPWAYGRLIEIFYNKFIVERGI